MRHILAVLVFAAAPRLHAGITVSPDRPDAVYATGASATFTAVSAVTGTASWTIRRDLDTPVLASGTLNLTANAAGTFTFSSAVPCAVLCDISLGGESDRAAAVFGAEDIQPQEAEPVDFDAWWAGQKALLAAVPPDPVVTLLSTETHVTNYRVNLANVDGRRVYGYLSVPHGAGPFPAVISLPPFGSAAGLVLPENFIAERGGALSMAVSIHNAEPDAADPSAYLPNDISSREGNYYRRVVLGCLRAIDYVTSRPDFNGTQVAVCGVSQGGGLSLIVAGLDPRVSVLAQSNAALCEHAGLKYGHASGFPDYIRTSRQTDGTAAHEAATLAATKYFDAVFHARRFQGTSLNIVSLQDDVCPPATVLAACNQLAGPKVTVFARDLGHSHPNEYWEGRFDLWRLRFPAMRTPPWPWPGTTTGYEALAGPDASVPAGQTAALSGTVKLNGTAITTLPVRWRKVSGPGVVTFSNAASAACTASFAAAGDYVLEFSAEDASGVSGGKRLLISDRVKLTAGGTGGPVNAAPSVNAGPDQTITWPTSQAALTGTATDDGLPAVPGALTLAWSKVSGPGTAAFSSGASAATQVTVSAPGVYVLRLEASDGALSTSDTLTLTVQEPPAPPAGASAVLTSPSAGSTVDAGAAVVLTADVTAPAAAPAHVRVTNPVLGWNRLNFGYNAANLWNPPNNVTAGGNTTLRITLKDFGGGAQWSKLWIYPQGDNASGVRIGSWLSGSAADWTEVVIPLSAFANPGLFSAMSHLSLPFSDNAAAFDIGISRVEFTGGTTPFLWYGGSHTDNALDGTGNPGTLPATRVAASAPPAVVKVEFLRDGTVVGEDTAAPWSASWNAVAGNSTLAARAIFSDGSSVSSAGVSLTVRSPWQVWQNVHFTAPEQSAGMAAPAADADADGFSNLLEYAMHASPRSGSDVPVMELWQAGADRGIRFRRNPSATDARLVLRISPDLNAWTDTLRYGSGGEVTSAGGLSELSRSMQGGAEVITVSLPGGAARLYLQLRAETP